MTLTFSYGYELLWPVQFSVSVSWRKSTIFKISEKIAAGISDFFPLFSRSLRENLRLRREKGGKKVLTLCVSYIVVEFIFDFMDGRNNGRKSNHSTLKRQKETIKKSKKNVKNKLQNKKNEFETTMLGKRVTVTGVETIVIEQKSCKRLIRMITPWGLFLQAFAQFNAHFLVADLCLVRVVLHLNEALLLLLHMAVDFHQNILQFHDALGQWVHLVPFFVHFFVQLLGGLLEIFDKTPTIDAKTNIFFTLFNSNNFTHSNFHEYFNFF